MLARTLGTGVGLPVAGSRLAQALPSPVGHLGEVVQGFWGTAGQMFPLCQHWVMSGEEQPLT